MDKKITYTNEVVNSYSSQLNCEAGIYLDGDIIGVVEYVLYDDELTVSDIFIKLEYRRQGYGSKLMKYIKQENPESKYQPSMMLPDGAKFIHKDLSLEEVFKAQFVSENINFERGKDPYRSLNIGDIRKRDFPNTISAAKWILRHIDKVSDFKMEAFYLEKSIGSEEIILNNNIRLSITKWIWQNFTFNKDRSLSSAKYTMHDIEYLLKEKGKIQENLDFERGKDVKDALGLGDRRIPKKGEYINAYDRFLDQISRVKVMDDPQRGTENDSGDFYYGIPDWWVEVEFEDMGSNFAVKYKNKPWEIDNNRPDDEALNENLDFERGKDVKQLMGIGLKEFIYKKLYDICYLEAIKFEVMEIGWQDAKTKEISIEWVIEFNRGQSFKSYLNKALKEKNLDKYFEFPGQSTGNRYDQYASYKIKDRYGPLFREMYEEKM